ncbi:MAG: diacylglycerol kinase family protein [Candidatus Pacebacteria bacterium]|nr:diacylglycerol kinase family protein [Candidatus Paceibacterota bacterium]
MEQTEIKSKEFSLVKRAQSFAHAGRGVWIFLKSTHNAWIHVVVFVLACVLGSILKISRFEWIALLFAGGLVFVAEALNTAIEIDIDLTSPTYHPFARDTKDVAAGAVLIAVLVAIVIGCIVFIPHVTNFI